MHVGEVNSTCLLSITLCGKHAFLAGLEGADPGLLVRIGHAEDGHEGEKVDENGHEDAAGRAREVLAEHILVFFILGARAGDVWLA